MKKVICIIVATFLVFTSVSGTMAENYTKKGNVRFSATDFERAIRALEEQFSILQADKYQKDWYLSQKRDPKKILEKWNKSNRGKASDMYLLKFIAESFGYKVDFNEATGVMIINGYKAPLQGNGNGLKGEYYNNIDFTSLKVTRIDPSINFKWGANSPDPSIDKDTFSVRWTGQILPLYSQEYTFYVTSDDGTALWVNGKKIIDSWRDQGKTEKSGKITLVAGEKVDLRLDYYENTVDSTVKLAWSSASQGKQIVPQHQLFSTLTDTIAPTTPTSLTATPVSSNQINLSWAAAADASGVAGYKVFRNGTQIGTVTNATSFFDTGLSAGTGYFYSVLAYDSTGNNSNQCPQVYAVTPAVQGNGNGLKGEYFDNADFTQLKIARLDPKVDFNWGTGAPDSLLGNETFSIRWTGQILPLYTEEYTFTTLSDDGIRLWINGVKLVDYWEAHSATMKEGKIRLTAGQKVDIRVEYYENTGDAAVKLSWSSPSQGQQVIPQSQLFGALY